MPPFAASCFRNSHHIWKMWRKRVGVEPTIPPAGDRNNGFEGHEGHRTLFASVVCNIIKLRDLLHMDNLLFFRNRLGTPQECLPWGHRQPFYGRASSAMSSHGAAVSAQLRPKTGPQIAPTEIEVAGAKSEGKRTWESVARSAREALAG